MKKAPLSFLAGFSVIFLLALTTDQIMQKVYDSANTALRVNVVTGGSSGTVTGTGANTQVAYWTSASALAGDAGMTYVAATDVLTAGTVTATLAALATPSFTMPNWRMYEASSSHVFHLENNDNLVTPHGLDLETETDFTEFDVYNTTFAEISLFAIDTGGGTALNDISKTTVIEDYTSGSAGLIIFSNEGPVRFGSGGSALTDEHGRFLTTGGHFERKGTAPAVTNTSANSCGTSPASLVGNDHSGKVTVGATSGTSCTVTFATAFTNAPACYAQDETTAVLTKAISTTTTVIISGVFTAADKLAYICEGYY